MEEDEVLFEKDQDLLDTESRIGELLNKDQNELTDEERAELAEKKKHRQSRYQQRINEMHNDKKYYQSEAEKYKKELEELRSQQNQQPKNVDFTPTVEDQVEANGKKFYTDKALGQMIQAGKMTQEDAWVHQQQRIKSEAVDELRKETQMQENNRIAQESRDKVFKEYPQFNPQHPRHDANDPLFKEASRLWEQGFKYNPNGMYLALQEAKKILRVTNPEDRPDLSDELSANPTRPNVNPVDTRSKVVLEEWEKDHAERLYVMSGMINPTTGRTYTKTEAYDAALKAKSERKTSAVRR